MASIASAPVGDLALGLAAGVGIASAIAVPIAMRWSRRMIRRTLAAERRARRAERLAEIGSMTSGLAHEIKNPLSTLGLNAQLLAEGIADLDADATDKARLARRVDALSREADRLRDILEDFLRFAGELRLSPEPADLNDIARDLGDFFAAQAQHHSIRLREEVSPQPLPVHVDVNQLKQALLNLMLNALEALRDAPPGDRPRAPEIILRTRRLDDADEGPRCAVHVIDTGPGISADRQAKVFEPYFTTKSGGSGLGLPTTRRIVEASGGSITITSEPDAGTDFRIDLPLRPAAPAGGPGRGEAAG
jgi:signal transduction histidine kinase